MIGIDPSGYGVIDDYKYQMTQKSNQARSSNFYTEYYSKKAKEPEVREVHNIAEYYKYIYGKETPKVQYNDNGKVLVKNPFTEGPAYVTIEEYNCLRDGKTSDSDVENPSDIDVDILEDVEKIVPKFPEEFLKLYGKIKNLREKLFQLGERVKENNQNISDLEEEIDVLEEQLDSIKTPPSVLDVLIALGYAVVTAGTFLAAAATLEVGVGFAILAVDAELAASTIDAWVQVFSKTDAEKELRKKIKEK